jgi:ABC-type polysaccharide/polyol phosphate export permease
MLRELVEPRHLLSTLTRRDISIRYKHTVLGLLWALLMPALIVAGGVLVKRAFAVTQAEPIACTIVT